MSDVNNPLYSPLGWVNLAQADGLATGLDLHTCNLCGAIVRAETAATHTEWHENLNNAVRRARSGPGMIR